MPKSESEISSVIQKQIKKSKHSSAKNDKIVIANLVLQRIRDYHHPLGSKSQVSDEEYKQFNIFSLSLLKLWISEKDKEMKKVYLQNLQEILSIGDDHVVLRYVQG